MRYLTRTTRVLTTIVVGSLAGGMSFDDIQREYDLRAEDIRAALKFAGELLDPSTTCSSWWTRICRDWSSRF